MNLLQYFLGKDAFLIHYPYIQNIKVCRADESQILNFHAYYLDIEPDGSVRKPDSLFMEAWTL
jgi:hypothetical protein